MRPAVLVQTVEGLRSRLPQCRDRFMSAKPFRYVIIDKFLPVEFVEDILRSYPAPGSGWDGTTYIHQRQKFVLTQNLPPAAEEFFEVSRSREFHELISDITGISDPVSDPELVGGGLHQIVAGGFLDVHVDFNRHPKTKLHRRLNLLVYLNKEWKSEYRGYLELWDMSRGRCFEVIAPILNRCVIFETNERSYHGHPAPLRTPPAITRKSLSVYYYTATRDARETAPEHNTLYRHTRGFHSRIKTGRSTVEALWERLRGGQVHGATLRVLRLLNRRLPPNR